MANTKSEQMVSTPPSAPAPRPARPRWRFRWWTVVVPLAVGLVAWAVSHVHLTTGVYMPQPMPVATPVSVPAPEESPVFDWDEFLDALGIVDHRKFTALFELGLFLVALALIVRVLREAARRVWRRDQEKSR